MYFHQSIFPVIVDLHKKYAYPNSTHSIRREKKPKEINTAKNP